MCNLFQRLQGMIKEAEDRGTKVVRIGDTRGANTRKEAPALLIDPPLDIQAMQEEIFGPILPIIPYDIVEEAMAFVAQRSAPLALYIFTDKHAERDAWLNKSLSGGVCINETSFHVVADSMPFGGVGYSGMGAYHGKAGECPIFCVTANWSMLPERSKDDDHIQGTAGRTTEGLRAA
ncbi:aldehyde dehydrogenase family protein [Sulfitobacter sp.]|uniref:aldehyde dehydrogenase family protein n=1 Tax=Sulfitobacter sp. TaxID=1903071 RepID=UPI003298FCA5